jgi:hypothetical protein
MKHIRKLGVALAGLAALQVQAASAYSETWDGQGNLAGWQANTIDSSVINPGAGGNPGGYLLSRRSGDFPIGAATEVAAATGSFAGAPMWTASVDLNEFEGDAGPVWLRFRFQDFTYNGWRYRLSDSLATDTWATYSVMFQPTWSDAEAEAAGWETDFPDGSGSVSWAMTMGDVYTTEVRFDGSRTLLVGIDNFTLAPVPEPGTWALMLAGLAGLGWMGRRRKSS